MGRGGLRFLARFAKSEGIEPPRSHKRQMSPFYWQDFAGLCAGRHGQIEVNVEEEDSDPEVMKVKPGVSVGVEDWKDGPDAAS